MTDNTNFVERLKALRKTRGLTQAEFAKELHLDRSYISTLESGKREIQPWLQDRIIVLEKEIVYPPHRPSSMVLDESTKGNVRIEPIKPSELRRVPVVSWTSAGLGGNYSDLEGFIDEYVETDNKDPNSYALIVEGDSMEPTFLRGDRIITTPNVEAQNGNLVVARLRDSGRAMLKLFHCFGPRADQVRLTSYNPAYPPLEFKMSDFRFIHPVHSMVRKWLH